MSPIDEDLPEKKVSKSKNNDTKPKQDQVDDRKPNKSTSQNSSSKSSSDLSGSSSNVGKSSPNAFSKWTGKSDSTDGQRPSNRPGRAHGGFFPPLPEHKSSSGTSNSNNNNSNAPRTPSTSSPQTQSSDSGNSASASGCGSTDTNPSSNALNSSVGSSVIGDGATAYTVSAVDDDQESSSSNEDSDSESSSDTSNKTGAFHMFKAQARKPSFGSAGTPGAWTEARRPESSELAQPFVGAFRITLPSNAGLGSSSTSEFLSPHRLSSEDSSGHPESKPSSFKTQKKTGITAGIHQHRDADSSGVSLLSTEDDDEESQMTWNEAYQRAIDMPDSNDELKQERSETIAQIAQDFVTTATMFGKIIISEVFLPNEAKTVKATTGIGGNAGGEKYVYKGILFKFAVDWKGIYTSDEYAMKAAALELKGLEQFLDFSPEIRVPLMCLIDYLGFRLIALALLPIGSATLVYGSDNAGSTVKANDPNDVMKKAGSLLNLKEHIAGGNSDFSASIHFPADIEGHFGTDKRFYALDLARLMPPTAPDKSKTSSQYLFRLFRTEFVRGYKIPLSPDAYSNFDKNDPNREQHRKEIVEATTALQEHIVFRIGALEASCIFNDRTKPSHFIALLHKNGINLRYLPAVRTRAGPYLRTFAMLEMIARGIKTHLRETLRTAVREQMILALQPYRLALVEQFNIMLGNVPDRKRESTSFWSSLHAKLCNQFESFPTVEQLRRELQRDLPGIFLMNNICTSSPQLDEDMPPMVSYECFTCDLLYPQGLCQVCAQTCHASHSLSKPKWRSSTYCSCSISTCCRSFEPKLSSGDHPLKTFCDVIGIGRVIQRASDLAGIALSKDAKSELLANPHQFIFVLPDVPDLLLKSKQLTITTLAEAQSLHLAARHRSSYERKRMFYQSNNLFEKTIKMSPGARSLRVLYLQVLYDQIQNSESVDEKILSKCVHYCQELRDAKVARHLITSLYLQSPEVISKVSDHLQVCFSIVLETGQTLKSNERTEVLEFIAVHGNSLISLDLGSKEYSIILDDDILTKLAEGCQKLQHLRLTNYNPRKVTDGCLSRVAAYWKLLRHIDLSSSPATDNVICAFAANCPFIRTLDVSSCSNLTSAALRNISKLSELTVLNVSYNTISEVAALGQCERLELLSMRACPIQRSQFSRLLQPVGKPTHSLKALELSMCTPDTPAVITDIFSMCGDLTHLYLDGWNSGEEYLVKELPKFSKLHLSLKGWKIHQGTLDLLKFHKIKVEIDAHDAIIPGEAPISKDTKGIIQKTLSDLAKGSRFTRQ